jgi:histidine ammonia-lyase
MLPILLDAAPLTIDSLVQVARHAAPVAIAPAARDAMTRSRRVVESALSDGLAHYGIHTGFGSLSRVRVAPDDLRTLQRNLIRSHAAGVAELLPAETVRAMMLLLAASLCRGLSGVRAEIPELLAAMLNAGVTPVIPAVGSVGASGDLAPLAHLALVLIGEGSAVHAGRVLPGGEALRAAHLSPITLEAKEGLALINGTHLMAASAALLVHDTRLLLDHAVLAACMSIDAARCTDAFLDARVHDARPQPGQRDVAAAMRMFLAGSTILASHKENDPRVQDPYSFRCTPQVLGAARDALGYVKSVVENELGAVTDNPLVFPNGDIVSAGNFHGMPLALALDTLAIAIAPIAAISERRVFWILSAFDPESNLRPYLTPKPGLCSGLMIAQYTAAACVNEIAGLATPASVVNIPTSAEIEDFNSFGPRAAAKARRILELARHVLAIELLCAAEAIDQHRPLRSGSGVEHAHSIIRRDVPRLTDDRPPAPDIEALTALIARAQLLAHA